MKKKNNITIVLKHLLLDAWERQISHEVSDNYVEAMELVCRINGIDINSVIPEDILSNSVKYRTIKYL